MRFLTKLLPAAAAGMLLGAAPAQAGDIHQVDWRWQQRPVQGYWYDPPPRWVPAPPPPRYYYPPPPPPPRYYYAPPPRAYYYAPPPRWHRPPPPPGVGLYFRF